MPHISLEQSVARLRDLDDALDRLGLEDVRHRVAHRDQRARREVRPELVSHGAVALAQIDDGEERVASALGRQLQADGPCTPAR